MRQIKFRGKRIDTGEWITGDLQVGDDDHIPMIGVIEGGRTPVYYQVQEPTIGQFTGLDDSNAVHIYEGDIVAYCGKIKHVVEFKHGMFGYTLMDGWFVGYGGNTNFSFNPLDKSKEHEVIGNVFDNPELIPNQPTAI